MSGMGEVLEEIGRGLKWIFVGLLVTIGVLLGVIVVLIVLLVK
jgi:uncharacterized membrane protein